MAAPVPGLSPEERSMRASIASQTSWANTRDRSARTAPAREARLRKYLDQAAELHEGHNVSPEFLQDVAERLRVIDLKRMALKSAKVRRQKALARKTAASNGGA